METDEGDKAADKGAGPHPRDETCSKPLSGNAAIEAMGHSAAQAHVKVDPKHIKELEGMFGLKGAAWKEISKRLFWRSAILYPFPSPLPLCPPPGQSTPLLLLFLLLLLHLNHQAEPSRRPVAC